MCLQYMPICTLLTAILPYAMFVNLISIRMLFVSANINLIVTLPPPFLPRTSLWCGEVYAYTSLPARSMLRKPQKRPYVY